MMNFTEAELSRGRPIKQEVTDWKEFEEKRQSSFYSSPDGQYQRLDLPQLATSGVADLSQTQVNTNFCQQIAPNTSTNFNELPKAVYSELHPTNVNFYQNPEFPWTNDQNEVSAAHLFALQEKSCAKDAEGQAMNFKSPIDTALSAHFEQKCVVESSPPEWKCPIGKDGQNRQINDNDQSVEHDRPIMAEWALKEGFKSFDGEKGKRVAQAKPAKSNRGRRGGEGSEGRGEKPPHTYIELIAMAIRAQETQRATLTEIYNFLRDKYDFFRGTYNGWKNSIRHNLSLGGYFKKLPKNAHGKVGKGHHWTFGSNFKLIIEEKQKNALAAKKLLPPAPNAKSAKKSEKRRPTKMEKEGQCHAAEEKSSPSSPNAPSSIIQHHHHHQHHQLPPPPPLPLSAVTIPAAPSSSVADPISISISTSTINGPPFLPSPPANSHPTIFHPHLSWPSWNCTSSSANNAQQWPPIVSMPNQSGTFPMPLGLCQMANFTDSNADDHQQQYNFVEQNENSVLQSVFIVPPEYYQAAGFDQMFYPYYYCAFSDDSSTNQAIVPGINYDYDCGGTSSANPPSYFPDGIYAPMAMTTSGNNSAQLNDGQCSPSQAMPGGQYGWWQMAGE